MDGTKITNPHCPTFCRPSVRVPSTMIRYQRVKLDRLHFIAKKSHGHGKGAAEGAAAPPAEKGYNSGQNLLIVLEDAGLQTLRGSVMQ